MDGLIFVGADHAGFELKEHLATWLRSRDYEVVDCGAHSYDPLDDYPDYCAAAARRAVEVGSLAIVLGGSGNGEQMAANKVAGARAALCWSPEIARLARAHNDANVCSIGARLHNHAEAEAIVDTFVTTPFSEDPRHVRRIAQLDKIR